MIAIATSTFAANGGAAGGRATDQGFLRQSAQFALMEIAMAQIALTNSQDAIIQEFAQQVITDHTAQLEQAQTVADELEVTLPDSISVRDQRTLDRLAKLSGEELDRAWTQLMVTSHSGALPLHQQSAQRSRSEPIRAYARAQLVPLAAHLTEALEISEQFRGSNTPTVLP